ncbi:MAG TPA: 1-(5-phosphoribosyl)-5-[(5-phosphoribosylamino)methylideneamino] imidazole-4-carboxamide isomerase [Acidimicrobiales bacterium]|nr:1-(5-phosphoribosyl)-5-[(5-phosphoribosylamino)methylideneamino] imidazole-4-carboxamide isomerase [Acidimicrobiales bacterium]
MIVVPAIDLREGHCVQLRGGSYDHELVRLKDPIAVATRWRALGFTELHLVDLDAATARGDNAGLVASIVALDGLDVHVGGGMRDDEAVARVLGAGARSVVVGTRAVADVGWLERIATSNPDRVSVALDVRHGALTTEGWQVQTARDPVELAASVAALPLCQIVVTAVDVEGEAQGPDLALVRRVRSATTQRLSVAGGVSSTEDLVALRDLGVDAAIVGTALYTGVLDPEALSEELHT